MTCADVICGVSWNSAMTFNPPFTFVGRRVNDARAGAERSVRTAEAPAGVAWLNCIVLLVPSVIVPVVVLAAASLTTLARAEIVTVLLPAAPPDFANVMT